MELSEAFYAGLSLVDTKTLKKASTNKEAFVKLYDVAVQNFGGPLVKDGQGNVTKNKGVNKISVKEGQSPNIKLYNDMAAALSAVLGTRTIQQLSGIPEAVYLTGNKWHNDVKQFYIDVDAGFGMKDYNSSDVILRYGNTYAGISLKKKPTVTSASPTMINNSFNTFLSGKDLSDLQTKINDIRASFYAKVIKEACLPNGPLGDLSNGMSSDQILRLDPNKKQDARRIFDLKVKRLKADGKSENIPLINLKGTDEIERGGTTRLPMQTREDFRKFVNEKLYSTTSQVNPLFQAFLDAMSDQKVSNMIADSLLNKTLKLKLLDILPTWSKNDFLFYLVEGVGQVNTNLIPNVATANIKDIHSVMITMTKLAKLPSSLVFDKVKTGTGAARVNFTLLKGKYKILDIVLRYKGNFFSMPQFLGTTTPEFNKLVKQGDKTLMGVGR
tara:strand:+ start:56 stop:1381 length:1326 start_codon:yes stop_codon:yes gene_type:complete